MWRRTQMHEPLDGNVEFRQCVPRRFDAGGCGYPFRSDNRIRQDNPKNKS